MTITSPPGVFDIVPEDSKEPWRNSYLWEYVESTMRDTAQAYGFREMRTPLFERTELFHRGVGETTDIVSKEMYTFEDKGGRSMSLRPEGTAPVIRSFIENQLYNLSSIQKLFYIGPMFRYERSQAGRYRQHHQFGVEAIGQGSPEQDAEVIDLIYTIFCKLGLKHLSVGINSVGDVPGRLAYRQALLDYLKQYHAQLSNDSKTRFETNPLRILDSKHEDDRKIVEGAPSILDYLSPVCKEHFQKVIALLETLGIPYKVDHKLVRGLDYYNMTVFEIVAGELGAQNSLVGGGRYDGLIKTLGGPDLPAMGFGCGIERVLQTMLKQQCPLPSPPSPLLYIVALGEEAATFGFKLLHDLRQHHLPVQMDFSGKKLNKILPYADAIKAKYVMVIGENELKTQIVELKEMSTGQKTSLPLSQIYNYFNEGLKTCC
jgi:histidyl-tRNA synthetase